MKEQPSNKPMTRRLSVGNYRGNAIANPTVIDLRLSKTGSDARLKISLPDGTSLTVSLGTFHLWKLKRSFHEVWEESEARSTAAIMAYAHETDQ